jgi:type II/III secretion system protein
MQPCARLLAPLLLAAAATGAAAGGLGGATQQVVIEATLLSVTRHEAMELGLGAFRGGQRIDLPTEQQLVADVTSLLTETGDAMATLSGDAALAASEAGVFALARLQGSQLEQSFLLAILEGDGLPRAAQVSRPLFASRGYQVAAISALQERPRRIAEGRRFFRDANALRDLLLGALPWLVDHGLPGDGNLVFEPFEVGQARSLALQTGLNAGPGVRARFRDGVLELSGEGSQPAEASLDFQIALPEDFTVLVRFSLPERLAGKQAAALQGFSAGVLVATDASPDPAEVFLVEHQTTPAGFEQTFTAGKGNVIFDVFPHATPSRRRSVTSVITKDGASLSLGALLQDGSTETKVETTVPALGQLPVLGLYFRGGSKRTRLRVDDLMVFVTPHVVETAD